jgi:LacI family transcriptional regulator
VRAKIGVLIDTATTWGAGLIEGIADFAHQRDEWHIFLGARGKYEPFSLPESWHGDGVIARVTRPELADNILERQIPAVNVSWYQFAGDRIPQCTCDPDQVAELAVNHFLERGFRQFGYCASSLRPDYGDYLAAAYITNLRRRAYQCHVYSPAVDPDSFLPSTSEMERMSHWLRGLPKPIGLLAFDSLQARQVAEICLSAGLEVPNQIALLGGEHDQLSCLISKPELSSIDHSPRRVGYKAAELLARILAGEAAPTNPLLLAPARVITRQSTDTVAIADDMLAAAILFIKTNSHRRIQINDILRAIPVSRRGLEKGFRKLLGRSPAEEIRRVRVDRAAQLLCDTSWSMPRVAAACGFERPELLSRAFRRELQMSPTEFRRKHLAGRRDVEVNGD